LVAPTNTKRNLEKQVLDAKLALEKPLDKLLDSGCAGVLIEKVYVAWTTDCLPLHYCTQRLENPKLTSHGHQDSWRGANSKHSTFRELSSGIFIRNCH